MLHNYLKLATKLSEIDLASSDKYAKHENVSTLQILANYKK